MIDFQRKKKIRKIIYSPISLILLSIVFILLVKGVIDVYKKEKLSINNLKQEQIEYEKLQVRKKTLNSSLEYLKTEQGIENEIRVKFRAVKEGEQVSVIVENILPTISTSTVKEIKGFWYNLFH
ncbi:MAG: hypothetical protein AAB683_01990 [Patescibacteria group bacterium]